MEVKNTSEFSRGESQLYAYLAILREKRLRAKQTNVVTQGLYCGGTKFEFVCITADGIIESSGILDIYREKYPKMVFNFIITMIETAMKSTPNAAPIKPRQQQENEVDHVKDEVWEKVNKLLDETFACSDDDDDDEEDMHKSVTIQWHPRT